MKIKIPEGTPQSRCRKCDKYFYFVRMPSGKLMPVDIDGTSHFATCAGADEIQKERDAPDYSKQRDLI